MTNTTSMIYLLIFAIVIFFIYTNIKNMVKYKKENMRILLELNEDDKTIRIIIRLLMVFMVLFPVFLIIGMINSNVYEFEQISVMVVLPILIFVLYVPLSKKTRISTIGIHKKSNLIRWDAIKGINYLKPNEKNIVKARILYKNYSKDIYLEISLNKDEGELESFKELAKEYRNKKKGKKSGK